MKRLLLVGGALAFSACTKGEGALDPPNPTTVTSIAVSAPSTTTEVGSTLQASATPLNASGNAVSGKTLVWTSTDQTIASVSQNGLITALAVGAVAIRASVDGKVGQLDIIVAVNSCTTPLALAVGEVRVLSGPTAVSCITVAGSLVPTDYLFVSTNADTTQDRVLSYIASAAVGAASSVSAGTSLGMAEATTSIVGYDASDIGQSALHDAMEARVRGMERQLLAGRSPSQLRRAAAKVSANASLSVSRAMAVGDTLDLRVPDLNSNSLCTTFKSARGVVKVIGTKAQIVEDIDAPAGGFTIADYQAIASEFDNLIYRIDTLWFGSPTDENNDGRITIFYTPEVNTFTPANSTGFIGGFFFGPDLFPKAIPAQNYTCPQSNEQEIFYVLAPDPNGTINNNKRTTSDVRLGTRGTIAHEFQHMINQGVRMYNPAVTAFETSWLNEGMSHFAEEAVGRAIRNYTDFQSLTYAQVTANQDDYNSFFRQNLLRFRTWMQRPDTSSPISKRAASQLAPRGAAWALVRYTADHYSNNNARSFFRRLALGPETSAANLIARAGVSFEEILAGYLVANFADDLGIGGLPAKYSYKSWNMRDVMSGGVPASFPLFVSPLPGQVSTKSLAGSGNYFRLTRGVNSANTTFRMLAAGGGNLQSQYPRVYVVRLN